jgi:hypothetical protein
MSEEETCEECGNDYLECVCVQVQVFDSTPDWAKGWN